MRSAWSIAVPAFPERTLKIAAFGAAAFLALLAGSSGTRHQRTAVTRGGIVPGAIEGQLSTDYRGAAAYSIPLELPPGTMQVAPDLSLVYNSHVANGLIGVGWSLNGLSSIERCMPLPGSAATARDLCLDGSRLIEVSPRVYRTRTSFR